MSAATALTITSDQATPVRRLAIAGVADYATAATLSAALHATLTTDGITTCIVDVKQLRILAATGITTMLQAHALALSRGVTFCLTNAHGIVAQVLHLTNTDTVLT